MVVPEILGLKLVPVAKALPPVEALYQTKLPILEAAFRVTTPAPQRLAGVVDVTVGMASSVTVTPSLVALSHEPLFCDA